MDTFLEGLEKSGKIISVGKMYHTLPYSVEPPVCDHPKCKAKVIAYSRLPLTVSPEGL